MVLPKLWWSALSMQNIPMMTPNIQWKQLTEVKPKMVLPWKSITLPKKLPETGGKMNVDEFAMKIKSKYPQYESLDNADLAKKMIDKYPQYGDQVDMTTFGKISEVDPNTGSRYWAIQDETNIFWIPKIPRFNNLKDKSVKEWATPLEVVWEFWLNLWKSALNLWSDVANFLLDPVDSWEALLKLGAWTAVNTYETVTWDEVWGKAKEYGDVASQAVQYFKDRYGSAEAFSKSAYQDPVGVFSDIVSLVWWGWALLKSASKVAPKTGALQRLGDFWTDLQRVWALDPANKVTQWMNYLWNKWLSYIPEITRWTLWKMTWTSSDTIKQVYKSAVEWSDEARKWLRWEIVDTDVLADVEQGVDAIKSNRKQLYWEWYNKLVENKTIANINDVGIDTLQSMYDDLWVTFDKNLNLDFSQSKITSKWAQQNLIDIVNDLKNWKDKTPVGLDILKQRIQDYARYTPEFAKSDRFSTMVSNKIKDKITQLVPEYEWMMKNYSQVTDLLKDIKSAISVWWNQTKKNVAITKLKSVFRDNQEFRKAMIQEIEKYSWKDIWGKIAWLQMSPLLPKWLAGVWVWIWATIWWYGAVAWALSNPFTLVPLLLTSPRIVGEVANAIWVSVNKLNKFVDFIKSKLPNADTVTDANRVVNNTDLWLPKNPMGWWVTPKQPLPNWWPQTVTPWKPLESKLGATNKLSPKAPKALKTPTPISKVDDALPWGEKMDYTPWQDISDFSYDKYKKTVLKEFPYTNESDIKRMYQTLIDEWTIKPQKQTTPTTPAVWKTKKNVLK